ncbi:MAG: redoxin domain-containing protein [Fimbriimonas sp.]
MIALSLLLLGIQAEIDRPVDLNLSLPSIAGDAPALNLADARGNKSLVLFFFSEQCGVTFYYKSRIQQIQRDFEPQGFVFVGIRGGKRQFPNEPLKVAETNYLNMKFADDNAGKLVQQFKIGQSVTFAVIDSAGVLRYQGGLDDNVSEKNAKKFYLRNALKSLAKGEAVKQKIGPALGCAIIPIQ